MRASTIATIPLPYREHSYSLRPREGAAFGTRPRGIGLFDFFVNDPCVIAFIQNQLFEAGPARIERGLGHLSFTNFELDTLPT